jgi:hypothetical protein
LGQDGSEVFHARIISLRRQEKFVAHATILTMDRFDLTARLTSLRAELADIHSQIREYRSKSQHSHFAEKEHLQREVRIREIRTELEGMMQNRPRT